MAEEGNKKRKIVTFVEAYRKLKRKRALKIIRKPDSEIYKVSFQGNKLRKWVHNRRRVGRPRAKWAEETVAEVWDHIKKDNAEYRFTAFNGEREDIIELIQKHARECETTSTR